MKSKRAIYAGSFDPLTLGHLWVIKQAAQLFDELTVAIGENPDKQYLFSVKQRKKHVEEALKELKLGSHISIEIIHNKFLVKYAEEAKIPYLVRGIRGPNDFNYELVMNQVNREMSPRIETIYLIPPAELSQISSGMVKGLVGPEGWEKAIQKYIPKNVLPDLKKL
ncbi:pantetheine-phosphate adenylyltransferase [bacterium]|nr:pantetheine-phosphate adenylyltransferase [bacterium]